jgi:hypothetical protein
MRKDQRGQRSGANKQEGSGIKPVISSENLEGAEHLRKKITKDGDQPAHSIKQKHPTRNTNKDNSTSAGGYRH